MKSKLSSLASSNQIEFIYLLNDKIKFKKDESDRITTSQRNTTLLEDGELDAHIPLSDVEKIKAAQSDVPVHVYAADHGFNCNHRGSFNEEASKLALERTLAHFAKHLS